MIAQNLNRIDPAHYSPESVGRLMTTDVPIVPESATIAQIEQMLLNSQSEFETINYIYITDQAGKLGGVISIKELFRQDKQVKVGSVVKNNLITIWAQADREQAAELAIRHNLKSIPVVDKAGFLLGVVPSDAILNILHSEHIEDILHQAGFVKPAVSGQALVAISNRQYFLKRLPWLVVGLFGGLLAAFIISFFEDMLAEMILLAAFIPAVVYMADAVGAQSQTIFIRQMAVDRKFQLTQFIKQEASVGSLLALVLSLLIALIAGWWWQSWFLMLILGLAFFLTVIMAIASAVILPWLFVVFKYDPAVASGPLATVIRDVLSIIIYLLVAQAVTALMI